MSQLIQGCRVVPLLSKNFTNGVKLRKQTMIAPSQGLLQPIVYSSSNSSSQPDRVSDHLARKEERASDPSKLGNKVHAIDNLSPVSRVAIFIRAGSRYEPDEVPGITHYLRASAGLTTHDSSIFGITRHMERAGASFRVSSDREYIVYRIDCLRDKLGYVLGFIDDTINKPEFRAWELVDVVQPRLKEELKTIKKNQDLVTNEALHKAAYRGGLAHSTFLPEHQIEKIKGHHLFDFVRQNYVLERMSFFGLGVDEQDLRHNIEERFNLDGSKFGGVSGATRYVGGEARIQADFPHTMVNFVVQGCPISDLKSNAALSLIGTILGGEKQTYVKYGDGAQKSLANLLSKFSPSFKSSLININHSDTGLFGVSITGPNDKLRDATKAVVKHVKKVMSSVSETDLKEAKKAAKGRSLILSENQEAVFNTLGQLHASGIVGQSALDHVEKLTLKDLQTVASQLLKSKPTIVSVGNPRFVPYLDEIDS